MLNKINLVLFKSYYQTTFRNFARKARVAAPITPTTVNNNKPTSNPSHLDLNPKDFLISKNDGSNLFDPRQLQTDEKLIKEKQQKSEEDQNVYVHLQKDYYLNKERQKKYFREDEFNDSMQNKNKDSVDNKHSSMYKQDGKWSAKAISRQISQKKDMESQLRIYVGGQFYMNTQHYIEILKSMVPQSDQNKKERNIIRQSLQGVKDGSRQMHKLKKYDRSEPRIQGILKTVEKDFSNYSISEKMEIIYHLTRLNSRIEVVDLVETFIKDIILKEMCLETLNTPQQAMLIWNLAKVDLRNRELIVRISLEIEQRLNLLKKQNQELIVTNQRKETLKRQISDDKDKIENEADINEILEQEMMKNFDAEQKNLNQSNPKIAKPLSGQICSLLFYSYKKLDVLDPDITNTLCEALINNDNILKYCDGFSKLCFLASFKQLKIDQELQNNLLNVIKNELLFPKELDYEPNFSYSKLNGSCLVFYMKAYSGYGNQVDEEVLNKFNYLLYVKEETRNEIIKRKIPPKWITESLWAFANCKKNPDDQSFVFFREAIVENIEKFNTQDLVVTLHSIFKIDTMYRATNDKKIKALNTNKIVNLLIMKLQMKKSNLHQIAKGMIKQMNSWSKLYYKQGTNTILGPQEKSYNKS